MDTQRKNAGQGLYKTDTGITEEGYTIKLLGRDDFEVMGKAVQGV